MHSEKTFNVLEDYLVTLNKFYNSAVIPVDFKNGAEATRLAVNAWAEETTKVKIKDLLLSEVVDSDTALLLVNVIYFKRLRKEQSNPVVACLRKLHTSKESAKEVQMMFKQSLLTTNTKCPGLNANAIEIPHMGGKTSMVILLPYEVVGLPKLEAELTLRKLPNVLKGLDSTMVELRLPRFKI
ncbi:hypothetical protein HPB49_000536 [Dermacentor silvarum]|uniref:Uncharacterized protein n=1 Tax=Dermacentor silvarum TaxID=543639 RepID=A0ACB8D187_DERSI|nr:hypothetical protein HPB49_000536 [Dermacentor silvarum]